MRFYECAPTIPACLSPEATRSHRHSEDFLLADLGPMANQIGLQTKQKHQRTTSTPSSSCVTPRFKPIQGFRPGTQTVDLSVEIEHLFLFLVLG